MSLEEMDTVFGSVGLAAADEALQNEINRSIGLTVYDADEKRDDTSDEKVHMS